MKTKTLSVRMEESILARVDRFEKKTGIERASLVRNAIQACLDFEEHNGFIQFPVEIIPKRINPPLKKPRVFVS